MIGYINKRLTQKQWATYKTTCYTLPKKATVRYPKLTHSCCLWSNNPSCNNSMAGHFPWRSLSTEQLTMTFGPKYLAIEYYYICIAHQVTFRYQHQHNSTSLYNILRWLCTELCIKKPLCNSPVSQSGRQTDRQTDRQADRQGPFTASG